MSQESEDKSRSKESAANILAEKKPFLMYGTSRKEGKTSEYVEQAIKAGFRFLDTACHPKMYNESGVGEGWTKAARELNLERSDFFIQTKYTTIFGDDPNRIPYDSTAPLEEQVIQSLEISLNNLQTSYLDSLIVHAPEKTIEDTMRVYRTMEIFVEQGKVLRLGISNCYDYNEFVSMFNQATIKPSALQNRFYSQSNFDTEIRQFCKEKGIWYQPFWTLKANSDVLESPEVREWAERKLLTPQTLMYAFLMQQPFTTPLSGTFNLEHMKEDMAVMKRIQSGEKIFESDEEIRKFEALIGIQ